eukprot:SAG22_NODE_5043_length_1101_cov_6.185629_2_plen_176_part_00
MLDVDVLEGLLRQVGLDVLVRQPVPDGPDLVLEVLLAALHREDDRRHQRGHGTEDDRHPAAEQATAVSSRTIATASITSTNHEHGALACLVGCAHDHAGDEGEELLLRGLVDWLERVEGQVERGDVALRDWGAGRPAGLEGSKGGWEGSKGSKGSNRLGSSMQKAVRTKADWLIE